MGLATLTMAVMSDYPVHIFRSIFTFANTVQKHRRSNLKNHMFLKSHESYAMLVYDV